MKRFFAPLVLFIFIQLTHATDLRGRVDGTHGYSPAPFPMAGVEVTLFSVQQAPDGSVTYIPRATTATGGDGMYYFRNIPPGSFVLQIHGINYPLQVSPQPAQDIQAVLLRF